MQQVLSYALIGASVPFYILAVQPNASVGTHARQLGNLRAGSPLVDNVSGVTQSLALRQVTGNRWHHIVQMQLSQQLYRAIFCPLGQIATVKDTHHAYAWTEQTLFAQPLVDIQMIGAAPGMSMPTDYQENAFF